MSKSTRSSSTSSAIISIVMSTSMLLLVVWLGISFSCCGRSRSSNGQAAFLASLSSTEKEDSSSSSVLEEDFSSLTSSSSSSSSYTFEQYLEDFEKSYDTVNNHENYRNCHDRRRKIFESNLAKINRHNSNNNDNKNQHYSYKLGVNAFTDLLQDEVPMGYNKHLAAYLRQTDETLSRNSGIMEDMILNRDATTTATAMMRRRDRRSLANDEDDDDNDDNWMTALGASSFTLDAVEDLPTAVDWRQAGVTTAIKSQGMCGSCWAFATTAVLESHVALANSSSNILYELSVQQLVSCVDNPHHCGGNGGCAGSTSELAFDHVMQHGIVDEWSFGYQSFHGANISCSVEDKHSSSSSGAVASIDGWVMLPRNNYEAVMNVLAKVGPLAVAVACSPWISYHSGVFPHGNLTSQQETDLNHLVVLEGYGTDEATGLDYWLVRNSWGPAWGEHGYIKLERVNPKKLSDDEQFCGMDTTTADGEACAIDENGHTIQPPPAKICGNSGILYDVSFPIGAHLV